jgi:hypothetical protein
VGELNDGVSLHLSGYRVVHLVKEELLDRIFTILTTTQFHHSKRARSTKEKIDDGSAQMPSIAARRSAMENSSQRPLFVSQFELRAKYKNRSSIPGYLTHFL